MMSDDLNCGEELVSSGNRKEDLPAKNVLLVKTPHGKLFFTAFTFLTVVVHVSAFNVTPW